jgi:hypothetical protein
MAWPWAGLFPITWGVASGDPDTGGFALALVAVTADPDYFPCPKGRMPKSDRVVTVCAAKQVPQQASGLPYPGRRTDVLSFTTPLSRHTPARGLGVWAWYTIANQKFVAFLNATYRDEMASMMLRATDYLAITRQVIEQIEAASTV